MTEWIITSSSLILIVLALRGLMKGKISLRLQYGLWALVLVRLLIPFSFTESAMSLGNMAEEIRQQPIIQQTDTAVRYYESAYDEIVSRYEELGITVTPSQMRQEAQEQIYSDTYHTIADSYAQEGVEVPEPQLQQEARQQAESISLIAMVTEALPAVWYAGMAAIGCALLVSNMYFYWRLRKSRKPLDMPDISLRVYHTDYVATPCLFGLVKPGIYLTEEVVRDTQMRNHVLAHELTHYRHRDHIWSILRGVCLMVHWYNPLVWAAAILSKRDAELACDESTIRTLGEKERMAYGRTLIGMTCVKHDPKSLFLTATTMVGTKKTLKERIALIAKKPKTALYTLIACLLVVSIAVGCTFTGANTEPTEDPTEPTTTPTTAPSEPTTIPTEPNTEPTEPVTVPTAPPQPLPTVPDTVQALPENYTLEDLVTSFDEYLSWTNEIDDRVYEYDTSYSMPLIYPFSKDAIAVQNEIQDDLLPWLLEQRNNAEFGTSPSYRNIRYEAALHDGVLSLLIVNITDFAMTYYDVYNFDMETGRLLDIHEMLERYLPGVSYPEFLMAVREHRRDEIQATQSTPLDFNTGFSGINTELVGMTSTALYLDQTGSLCLRYNQLSLGGADSYPAVTPFSMEAVDWERPTRQEAYEWLFSIPLSQEAFPHPYDSYKETLFLLLQNAYAADPEEFTYYLEQADPTVRARVEQLLNMETEVVTLPEDYTLQDLVASYDEYLSWTDQYNNTYFTTFSMPLIYPFSQGAIEAQQQISDALLLRLEIQREAMASDTSAHYDHVRYSATLNDGVLSIVTEIDWPWSDSTAYSAYNLDLETGALLTTADMAQRYLSGISYPEYLMALTQLREEDYRRNASEMTEDPPESFMDTELDYDTVAMSGAALYLDRNGVLQITYEAPTPAGAGHYRATVPFSPDELDWTPPTREEAYEWFLTLRTDGAYTTSYIPLLYDALYASPAEFVENLARLPQADRDEVLMLMEWEAEFYGPGKLPQTVAALEAAPDLSQEEQAIIARLSEFADSLS